MSSKVKESISALVDGQTDGFKCFDKLKQDPQLVDCFGRYHLIGDAMRNELPTMLNLDIASEIAKAIDKEPVILAPNAKQTAQLQSTNTELKTDNKLVQLFKPMMQYGIAASFAAALVFGLQVEQQTQQVQVPQPVLQTLPIGGSLDPVSMQQVEAFPSMSTNDAALQRQRINSYIMDHAQQLKTRQQGVTEKETTPENPVSQ